MCFWNLLNNVTAECISFSVKTNQNSNQSSIKTLNKRHTETRDPQFPLKNHSKPWALRSGGQLLVIINDSLYPYLRYIFKILLQHENAPPYVLKVNLGV